MKKILLSTVLCANSAVGGEYEYSDKLPDPAKEINLLRYATIEKSAPVYGAPEFQQICETQPVITYKDGVETGVENQEVCYTQEIPNSRKIAGYQITYKYNEMRNTETVTIDKFRENFRVGELILVRVSMEVEK